MESEMHAIYSGVWGVGVVGGEGKGLPVKNKGEKWGEERMETALHAQQL